MLRRLRRRMRMFRRFRTFGRMLFLRAPRARVKISQTTVIITQRMGAKTFHPLFLLK